MKKKRLHGWDQALLSEGLQDPGHLGYLRITQLPVLHLQPQNLVREDPEQSQVKFFCLWHSRCEQCRTHTMQAADQDGGDVL